MQQQSNMIDQAGRIVTSLWRHRPGHEVPAAILDTVDALWPPEKPRPLLTHKKKSPGGWHMIFTLQPGVSYADVEKHQSYFADAARKPVEVKQVGGYLHINVKTGTMNSYYRYDWNPEPYMEKMNLPIPIGYGTGGELVVTDLAALPHLRVGGTTFTGKSNFLHTIFLSLAMLSNVRLAVIDMALLEFSYVKDAAVFASNTETALRLLQRLEKEMHRRRRVLNAAKVVKIQDYKKEDLPFIILIVDEFSFLNPEGATDKAERDLRKQCQSICSNLAALARKVGIHLILAMQRPDMKILPGQLKANLPGAISFKTINRLNSEIILDNGAAAELPDTQGRAIWQVGNQQQEVQVMHLPVKRARKMLKQLNRVGGVRHEQQDEGLLPRQGNS